MHPGMQWVKHADTLLTGYKPRQKENPQNNSTLVEGIPGSGKNYMMSWLKDFGLASDNIKLFEIHASDVTHLEEILQFSLPNGFYENRDSRIILNQLLEDLEEIDCEISENDVEDLIDALKSPEVDNVQRVQKVGALLSIEENNRVRNVLKEVMQNQKAILDKLSMMDGNVRQNPDMPSTFSKSIRGREGNKTFLDTPSGFEIKVFTPISFGMPTDTDIPEFFEPFAIPIDAFKKHGDLEEGLKIIFGDNNIQGYRNIYNNLVDVGDTSFADIKFGDADVDRDHVNTIDLGFTELEVYDPDHEGQSMRQFQSKFASMFNSEGVVCSSGFEHKLRPKLKEAILSDEDEVITLYTGFLRDEGLQKFVMTYFLETYKSIIENLDTEEVKELDKGFVVSILESQDIVKKSGRDRKVSLEESVFKRFMRDFMNKPRHFNTDVWVDSKVSDTTGIIREKINHHYITRVSSAQFDALFSGEPKQYRDNVRSAFRNEHYNKIGGNSYGFIYLNEGDVKVWQNKNTYGYRLPCPRLTLDTPVTISNTDFSLFTEELGMESFSFQSYVEELVNDWEDSEKQPINVLDKELEEKRRKEEEEENKMQKIKEQTAIDKLRAKVSEAGQVPDSWRGMAEEVRDEMVEAGMIDEDFTVKQILEYTKEFRDQKENEVDEQEEVVDKRSIIDDLKKNRDFVVVAGSKKVMKHYAEEMIREGDYGVPPSEVDQFADECTELARSELINKDNVLNNQNNLQVSEAEWEKRFSVRSVKDNDEEDGEESKMVIEGDSELF